MAAFHEEQLIAAVLATATGCFQRIDKDGVRVVAGCRNQHHADGQCGACAGGKRARLAFQRHGSHAIAQLFCPGLGVALITAFDQGHQAGAAVVADDVVGHSQSAGLLDYGLQQLVAGEHTELTF